jgi:predicted metal-binding membrane protein
MTMHKTGTREEWLAARLDLLGAEKELMAAWKAYHLSCCRKAPGRGHTLPADVGRAWRHGLLLGRHCSRCCVGLIAILLVIGVMDLRAMTVVAAAITVERLAPAGSASGEPQGSLRLGQVYS